MSENNDSDGDDILNNLLANDDDDGDDVVPSTSKIIKELEYDFMEKIENSSNSKECEDTSTSLVHDSILDSSDDEETKYFNEGKYSESGRKIKELLKHQASGQEQKEIQVSASRRINKNLSSSMGENVNKYNGEDKNERQQQPKTALTSWLNKPSDVYSDPVFGLRIIKPLISSSELKERMQSRKAITVSRIKYFLTSQDQSDDWVIAGVLIHRSTTKKSQNGNHYCIWQISDLSDKIPTVSIFLFSNAYKSFWKTTEGTIIGILNPSIMESRSDKSEATLSVDNAQKIMIFGNSRDFGRCKSVKKNGDPCTNIVNINTCQYCVYHVKQEYSKASRRTDLQTDSNNRRFANAFGKQINNNSTNIGGLVNSHNGQQNGLNRLNMLAIPAKRNYKMEQKDAERLALLKGKTTLETRNSNENVNKEKISKKCGLIAATRSALSLTTICDLSSKASQIKSTNVMQKNSLQNQGNSFLPCLGAGLTGDIIDFSKPITKKQISAAKINAIKLIKEKGGVKAYTNVNKICESRQKIEAAKRKRETTDQQEVTNEAKKICLTNNKSFKELMEATSAHVDLIEKADEQEKEKYFNKLEAKERMEEKMMNTFKVDCKAVKCLICKYTSFSASDICKEKRHPLRVIDAVKSFFKCADCANRTVSLDKLPSYSCQKCSGSRWLRAAMMDEKKTNITENPLSIRGGEEKFINSQLTNTNINLLVPDDEPL